jgi:hypothetical protein
MPTPQKTARLRPAAPSCRGGASSLLRLTPHGAQGAPSLARGGERGDRTSKGAARQGLGAWLARAAGHLVPRGAPALPVFGLSEFAASRLQA